MPPMNHAEAHNEKYAGPGRLAAALGAAKIDAFIGGILGAIGGGAAGYFAKSHGKMDKFLSDLFRDSKHFATSDPAMRLGKGPAIAGGVIIGSGALSIMGLVWGAVKGWGQANKGEQQFNQLKEERNLAIQKAESLESQVTELESAVHSERKKFADLHASHAAQTHGSHTAALEAHGHVARDEHTSHTAALSAEGHASHAEHGSFAAAHEAQKEHNKTEGPTLH